MIKGLKGESHAQEEAERSAKILGELKYVATLLIQGFSIVMHRKG